MRDVRALTEPRAPQQVDIKGATAKSFHANGDHSTEGRRVGAWHPWEFIAHFILIKTFN